MLALIGELGAELARELELLVDDVDRDDPATGDRRVLDREVAETADAEHSDEIGGAGAGDLDRLVRGDAGAGQRRRVERVDAVGDLDDVTGVGRGVLAEAAVDRVAHHLLLRGRASPGPRRSSRSAARVAEPGHRDAVTDGDLARRRGPNSVTMPTPSWPGMNGGEGLIGQSPFAA